MLIDDYVSNICSTWNRSIKTQPAAARIFHLSNGWLGVLRQKKLESDQGIFVSDLNNGRNKSYDKVQNMPRKVRVHAVPMFVRISVMIYLWHYEKCKFPPFLHLDLKVIWGVQKHLFLNSNWDWFWKNIWALNISAK